MLGSELDWNMEEGPCLTLEDKSLPKDRCQMMNITSLSPANPPTLAQ